MSTYFKNVLIFASYLSFMISINILQCIAVELLPANPNEDTNNSSRSGLLQLNPFGVLSNPEKPIERVNLEVNPSPPQGQAGHHPIRSGLGILNAFNPFTNKINNISSNKNNVPTTTTRISSVNNNNNSKTNVSPDKIGQTATATPSLDELEKALLEPGIECGKVPLFENLYKRSINESFDKNPDEESEGEVRILHGLDSKAGEWPWIVRIKKCDNGDEDCKMCTGTLLNSRWVITAGHCKIDKVPEHDYKATVGLYDLVTPDEGSYDVEVDKLIRHPDYKDLNNDLLLIKLAKPVKFNEKIQPACFVHRTRNIHMFTKHRKCYTVGYGLTDGMVDAIKLQKLEISTKDPSECNSDQLGSVRLRRGTVCVGPPDGKEGGSCKGDSGGPDLCYDPKGNHWVLFGTVSYGPAVCDREQGQKWLTVSTDLSNFRTWILSTIYQNSKD